MMFMTAKVDIKKLIIVLVAIVGVILALVLLLSGRDSATQTAATVSDNDSRVSFLRESGWDVNASPIQSGQVRIPQEQTEIYKRYNALQESQGYDLTQYAGKTVMRYVYKVNNFPDATEPVYATVLVYKDRIIGGDVTDTSAKGCIQGLKKQADVSPTIPMQEATEPAPSTAPTAE